MDVKYVHMTVIGYTHTHTHTHTQAGKREVKGGREDK